MDSCGAYRDVCTNRLHSEWLSFRFISFHLVSFQCVHLPYDEEPMNDGVIGNDVCACPNMKTMNGTRSVSLRSRQLLLRDSLAPKQVEDRDNG